MIYTTFGITPDVCDIPLCPKYHSKPLTAAVTITCEEKRTRKLTYAKFFKDNYSIAKPLNRCHNAIEIISTK